MGVVLLELRRFEREEEELPEEEEDCPEEEAVCV